MMTLMEEQAQNCQMFGHKYLVDLFIYYLSIMPILLVFLSRIMDSSSYSQQLFENTEVDLHTKYHVHIKKKI